MLVTLDLKEAAKKAAANWNRFDSFVWLPDRELQDADKWAVIYTHNRDSSLLSQSNAHIIEEAMKAHTDGENPDVVMESHSHWAVGHVNGFSVRVFNQHGEITQAFQAYHELAEQLNDYPILDELDYSAREYEATLENIKDAAWQLKNEFNLPEGWESEVYSWLSDHRNGEIENRDDKGGYPSEDALHSAFVALGFEEED